MSSSTNITLITSSIHPHSTAIAHSDGLDISISAQAGETLEDYLATHNFLFAHPSGTLGFMQHHRAEPGGITYATLLLLFIALTASTGIGYSLAQHKDGDQVALAPQPADTPTDQVPTEPMPIVTSPQTLTTAAQNAAQRLVGRPLSSELVSKFIADYQASERIHQTDPLTTPPPSPEVAADAFVQAEFPNETKSPQVAAISDFNDSAATTQ